MDLVVRSPQIPRTGQTVLGSEFIMNPGGKGANQAVAAAKLGARVHLVARLGDDLFAPRCAENFKTAGINTDYVFTTPGVPSGVALITVDDQGNNAIVVAPGANRELSRRDVEAAAPALASAELLLVQLEVPLETVERAIQIAHDAHVPVILDPAPAVELDPDTLAMIEVITPNQTEAEVITGVEITGPDAARTACESLLQRNVRSVALTMGAEGVMAACDEGFELVPAVEVETLDSTAAGDAFAAALAVELARGRTFLQAVDFARFAAALSVTRAGAQSSMPSRKQVETFIKNHARGQAHV